MFRLLLTLKAYLYRHEIYLIVRLDYSQCSLLTVGKIFLSHTRNLQHMILTIVTILTCADFEFGWFAVFGKDRKGSKDGVVLSF